MTRYFIGKNKLIIIDEDENVEVLDEVSSQTDVFKNPELITPKKNTKKDKKIHKKTTRGRLDNKMREHIEELIKDDYTPAQIHSQTGVSIPTIYKIRNEVNGDDAEMEDEKDDQVELDLVEKIRDSWANGDQSSIEVCKELDISLARFNKIIQEFKIVKR